MLSPDFEAWSLFVAVAQTGSFAAAARQRGLSVPTVSRAIARLEGRMGASLFHRTSRRLSLSSLGQEALAEAQELVASAQRMEERLGEATATPSGNVRLAAPMDFGRTYLAPVLAEFLETYPDISIDMELNDARIDIVASGHDMVLRIGQLEDSSLIARRLCPVRRLIVGAPAYWDKHGRPRHPSDLGRHKCLRYTNMANPNVWQFQGEDRQSFAVTISGPLQSDSGSALMPALYAGLGVAMLPDFMVHADLKAGRLETVLDVWEPQQLAAWILTPPHPLRPLRVRLLMDWLSQRITGPALQAG